MQELNKIGLDQQGAEEIAVQLNALLANYQVFYQNLRAVHWNVKGVGFFELHEKFEEYYTNTADQVDEIAERILTLGFTPLHTFEDYIAHSSLKSYKGLCQANESVKMVVDSYQTLIVQEREIMGKAADINDEGTASMMSDLIGEQEKNVWMLNAWLQQ